LRDGRPGEWEDAPVMTKNSDIIAGTNAADKPARRAPRVKPQARLRKPSRASGLLSAVLRKPRSQAKTVMICQYCEMTGGPFAPGEAALLLAVHEQLHHGGVSLHRPSLPPAL
jgi:hypothetical protein